MTNRNDNRQQKGKQTNNANSDTEFSKDVNIRSEITKRDLRKN